MIGALNQKMLPWWDTESENVGPGNWDTESENVAMVIGALNTDWGTQKMLPW